ncbi:HIT family protein [Bacteroidota bacterium]
MTSCKFCNVEESNVIKESDYSCAFYDKYPVNNGHVLVIPKRHIENYFDLTRQEKDDLWKLVEKIKIIIDQKFKPDGYNVGINIGETAGQTIFHCHIHIIPRYKGDIKDPEGGIRGVIPSKQKY